MLTKPGSSPSRRAGQNRSHFANDYDYFRKKYLISDLRFFIFSYLCKVHQKISHSGIVESVTDGCVKVRILQAPACGACQVASHCHAAELKEKIVEVFGCDTANYSTGQEVMVSTTGKVVNKALVLGFGIPFLLVLGVLVVVLFLTDNEGAAALAALGSLLPYYFLLWLRRDSIQHGISFQIEDINI